MMKFCLGVLLSFTVLGAAPAIGAQLPESKIDADEPKQVQAARVEPDAAGAQAPSATIVLRSDADCVLSINAQAQGELRAGQVRSVKVIPGEQLVDCISAEFDRVQISEVKTATAGTQSVVMLKLADRVSAERAARDAALREAADRERLAEVRRVAEEQKRMADYKKNETVEQKKQAAALKKRRAALQVRFVAKGDTVRDKETGLVWTNRDNGGDIDWNKARAHCADLPGKWELPTVAELRGLYDPTGTLTQPCLSKTCMITPLIKLSGFWFWSQQAIDEAQAWGVYLDSSRRYSGIINEGSDQRALCVKRS